MPKQVYRKCLFVLILFSSLYQISYAKTQQNQTVSSDPSEFFQDSAPDSFQETLSPGNHYFQGTPILETEDQSVNELYSAPPELELEPEANGYTTSQITNPAAAPSADVTLQETEEVSEKPEAINSSETEVEAPAPATGFPLPETKSLYPEPERKSLSPEPELSIQLPETDTVTPTPLLSNADNFAPTETTESAPTEESTSAPEVDTGSTQQASPGGDVDDGVDMPPMPNNPSDYFPSNYSAEDETFDIVHEEYNGGWGSWDGQKNLAVAGAAIGVCFVGLAGFVFNNRKNKKKTQFQYQPLSKGV